MFYQNVNWKNMEVKIIAGTDNSCWCFCRHSGTPKWWDIPGVPLGGCRSQFISAVPAWTHRNLKLCMVRQFNLLPIDLIHHGHKTNSCVHMFRSPASFNETLSKSKSSPTSYIRPRTEALFALLSYICFQIWVTQFKWHLRVWTDWLHSSPKSMKTHFPKMSYIKRGTLSFGEKCLITST